jgi:hypothetical protein
MGVRSLLYTSMAIHGYRVLSIYTKKILALHYVDIEHHGKHGFACTQNESPSQNIQTMHNAQTKTYSICSLQ